MKLKLSHVEIVFRTNGVNTVKNTMLTIRLCGWKWCWIPSSTKSLPPAKSDLSESSPSSAKPGLSDSLKNLSESAPSLAKFSPPAKFCSSWKSSPPAKSGFKMIIAVKTIDFYILSALDILNFVIVIFKFYMLKPPPQHVLLSPPLLQPIPPPTSCSDP